MESAIGCSGIRFRRIGHCLLITLESARFDKRRQERNHFAPAVFFVSGYMSCDCLPYKEIGLVANFGMKF